MAMELPVPLAVAVPWPARESMLQVSVSLSASVACRVRAKAVGTPFLLIVTEVEEPSVITGGVLLETCQSNAVLSPSLSICWTRPPSPGLSVYIPVKLAVQPPPEFLEISMSVLLVLKTLICSCTFGSFLIASYVVS